MLNRSDVDGVPVFWLPGPEPLSASLVFRVGVRDETLPTCGITHLVEHLAMSALARRRHEYNASVDLTTTVFTVTARPDAVVTYLRDVCAALRALPLERLATEAKVLEAESGSVAHPAVAEQLQHRYGLRGLGLADVEPPALDQLEPAAVSAYAARYFTRDNAALALTGPPPPGLTLDLPPGRRAPIPEDPSVALSLPGWFAHSEPAVSASFLVDADDLPAREAVLTVLRVAQDRAEDELRHRRGWIYQVEVALEVTTTGVVACLHADPPEQHAEDVRSGLLDILRSLRDHGPTPAELAEDLEGVRDHLADPRSVEGYVGEAAMSYLVEESPAGPDERLRARQQVDADRCRRVLARLDETLIVGMPPDVAPADGALRPAPTSSSTTVTGRTFRRSRLRGRLDGVPRGATLHVGDAGVTLEVPDGPITVRWDGLVGASHDPVSDVTTLIGVDGFMLPVSARWFRNGAEAMALLDDKIPDELRFVERADAPKG